MEDYIKTLF